MRTKNDLDLLRERAITLRREGKSRREIEGWTSAALGSATFTDEQREPVSLG